MTQPPQTSGPGMPRPVRLFAEPPAPAIRARQFWSEPFRPFFLAGWVISLVALALWPLFFLEVVAFPARAHAFLMIQGFFAAFAVGFLWTALPRMLEVPGPGPRWIGAGLLLLAANTALHLAGAHLAGHLAFLALLGLVAAFGIGRFPARRDLPPPSLVLVLLGVFLGAAGTVLVATGETGLFPLGSYGYLLGRLLLTEVFLLFLVMGVAAFLAPRFLGQRSRQSFPDSRTPTAGWTKQALLSAAAGLVILGGAMLQAGGAVRTGALMMAIPLTAYVLYQVPLWRGLAARNWMADALRFALLCSVAAPWMRLLFPEARMASAHLLLLGGFGLLTLVVGTRVVFGHSGFGHLFKSRFHSLGVLAGLYVTALVLRLAGEFLPGFWVPLLMISALLVLGAHLLWGFLALPKVFLPREDPEPSAPPVRFPGSSFPLGTLPANSCSTRPLR